MEIVPTALPEVKLLRPVRHRDNRGWFSESWNRRQLARHGIDADFVQDNLVHSGPNGVLRGLHYQRPPAAQGKLIAVLRGSIHDVAVDIRHSSPNYGRHVALTLQAGDGELLWIPPGFAHGYCTLVPDCLIMYKVTAYYDPKAEAGIRFDDPALGIAWPLTAKAVVATARDRALPTLAAIRGAAAMAQV